MNNNTTNRKVVIIGAGHVGSHAGYALVSQNLVEEIVYIDVDEKKALAQALDLYDSTLYLHKGARVKAGDYSDLEDASLVIISAGPLPDLTTGETRMDTLSKTVAIIKDIVKNIKTTSYDGLILNISNPADVVTHYLQHELGWDEKKIFSTSTTLDSARLKRAIAEEIGINQKSIIAYALGEHGESQMVPWSTVSIAGKPLFKLMEERPDTYGKLDLQKLANLGRGGGWTILHGKGYTEFGIGASIAEVVRAIFGDENKILPVSVKLNGEYGQTGVYASVPAVINRNGIADIIPLDLNEEEQKQFDASCKTMRENFELAITL